MVSLLTKGRIGTRRPQYDHRSHMGPGITHQTQMLPRNLRLAPQKAHAWPPVAVGHSRLVHLAISHCGLFLSAPEFPCPCRTAMPCPPTTFQHWVGMRIVVNMRWESSPTPRTDKTWLRRSSSAILMGVKHTKLNSSICQTERGKKNGGEWNRIGV